MCIQERIKNWEEIRKQWGRWCQENEWKGNNEDIFYVSWLAPLFDGDGFPVGDYLEFGFFPPADDDDQEMVEIGKDGESIPDEIKSQLEEVVSFAEPIVIQYEEEEWFVGWLGQSNGYVVSNPDDLLFGDDDSQDEFSLQMVRVNSLVS